MHKILIKQIVKAACKGKDVAVLTEKARDIEPLMNQILAAFDPSDILAVSRVHGRNGITARHSDSGRSGRVNFFFRGAAPCEIQADHFYVPLESHICGLLAQGEGLVVGYEANQPHRVIP